jgi:hypothetical protein
MDTDAMLGQAIESKQAEKVANSQPAKGRDDRTSGGHLGPSVYRWLAPTNGVDEPVHVREVRASANSGRVEACKNGARRASVVET